MRSAVSSGPSDKTTCTDLDLLQSLLGCTQHWQPFHVSWYIGYNNGPRVEYAFFRASERLAWHFDFFFVVRMSCNNFFFILRRCAGMLLDRWTFCWYCRSLNLCRVCLYPPVFCLLLKFPTYLLCLDILVQFTYHWYARPKVMFCFVAWPDDPGPFRPHCDIG